MSKAAALGFASLLALASTGCALDETLPEPGVATPAVFDAGPARAAAGPSENWPASFGSRELARLAEQAQSQNLDILAAVARIKQADAQARVTAAALYPSLTGNALANDIFVPGYYRSTSPPYNASHTNALGLNLSASYELDFWGKNRDSAASAQLLAQASRYDRDVVALSTTAAVVNSYFQILAAQDYLRVTRQHIAMAEKVLRAIDERKAVGTSSALDEAQQATILAQQRALAPPLEQIEAQTRNTLAVLLSRTPESSHIGGGTLERLATPPIRAGLPSQMLLRRPDLAEAEDRLAAQGLAVNVARAAFFPDVSLTGQFGIESLLLKNLLSPQAAAYSLAGGLTQPIFNGGALQGQLDLQHGKYDENLQLYRKQILNAFSDVENGLIAFHKTGEQLELQRRAAASAQKAYDVAFLLLRGGTIDIVTLATNETALFQAENALVQVRLAHFQAATTLYQALGGGWSRPPEVNVAAMEN